MKTEIGSNVEVVIEDGILTMTCDLSRNFGRSKSGKTITIATTRGNVRVRDDKDDEVVLGINVYRYPTEDEQMKEGS